MPCKSAEWLQEELEARGGASLLLLDCRPHELFESSHIETAINLAIPGLMLRRLRKGNLPIRSIIPNHADKERFATRCKAATVLLYDEATAEWQPEPGAPPRFSACSCRSCETTAARPTTSKVVSTSSRRNTQSIVRLMWTARPPRVARRPPPCWAWGPAHQL